MFLPFRLLALELKRSNCDKDFYRYLRTVRKAERNSLRIKFLQNCKQADIVPHFLKFRVPNNGCFDDQSIKQFQQKLLHKEIVKAREDQKSRISELSEQRNTIKQNAPIKTIPSIVLFTRLNRIETRKQQKATHDKKLSAWSKEQERPLFSVDNTVLAYELDAPPPEYVMKTLSLGPKNAVLDKFDPKDVLAELDELLVHCKNHKVSNETITDINIKTLNYIKKCRRMKSCRNITMTKKYLKDNELLAVPFEKGIGICVMKKKTYESKLEAIIDLP